jgi:hypothetical protein
MSNFVQWAQLGVASAQLDQLHSISRQFQAQWQAQHDAHRRQAILADMLYQTERRAKQLSLVAERDALVAAMFADEWLSSVRFVGPDAFIQIEHKKVWATAIARMQALLAPLGDPSGAALVHQVRSALAEIRQIQSELAGQAAPEQRLAALSAERGQLDRQRARAGTFALALGIAAPVVPFVLFFASAIFSGVLRGLKASVDVDVGCMGTLAFMLFLGLGAGAGWQFSQRSDKVAALKRTEGEAQRLGAAVARWQAFAADPARGGTLARFQQEHPAFNQPLPEVDDAAPLSQVASGPTHIVERQIVMVRCKFCQTLTPVDGATCRNCGAGGFS